MATTKNNSTITQARQKNSGASKMEASQEVCRLSDKDIISDVLSSHKGLIKLYATALCETSANRIRSVVNSNMTECAADQFDAFNYMSERGLYPTETAPTAKLNDAKTKFCACEKNMKK